MLVVGIAGPISVVVGLGFLLLGRRLRRFGTKGARWGPLQGSPVITRSVGRLYVVMGTTVLALGFAALAVLVLLAIGVWKDGECGTPGGHSCAINFTLFAVALAPALLIARWTKRWERPRELRAEDASKPPLSEERMGKLPQEKPPMRRMLDRPAELIDLGQAEIAHKPWWRRWSRIEGAHNFSLVQDGKEVAAISTEMTPGDDSFRPGTLCRHTSVTFNTGGWTIRTHGPGRRVDKVVFGGESLAYWEWSDRIVEVTEGGEQIAYQVNLNPAAWHSGGLPMAVKLADGRIVTSEALTIKMVKGPRYLLTPASSIPLEAALLHWHIMLGDFQDTYRHI